MNILANAWEKWVNKDELINAAKRVGISVTCLNIDWMDQESLPDTI